MTMDINNQSSLINCNGYRACFEFRIFPACAGTSWALRRQGCFPPKAGGVSSIVPNKANRRRRPERSRTDPTLALSSSASNKAKSPGRGRETRSSKPETRNKSEARSSEFELAPRASAPNKPNFRVFGLKMRIRLQKQSQSEPISRGRSVPMPGHPGASDWRGGRIDPPSNAFGPLQQLQRKAALISAIVTPNTLRATASRSASLPVR